MHHGWTDRAPAAFERGNQYTYRVKARDKSSNLNETGYANSALATTDGAPVSQSIERGISAGNDDAEEATSGFMPTNSSDLELVYDGSNQTAGLRFTNTVIPQGATIINAYIEFTVAEINSGTCSLTLKAEDHDNAPDFYGNYCTPIFAGRIST